MHTASQQFITACQQQGVQLNKKVIEDLAWRKGEVRRSSSMVYHSPMVRTIQEWAWNSEAKDPTNPDYQIANKPIAIGQLPPDPIMRMLAHIANAALRPRIPLPVFTHLDPVRADGTCRDAEKYWNEVFNRIADPNRSDRPRMELFTQGDTIVALRKAISHPTGILLRRQRLGRLGYEYPAGSLIQLETRQDIKRNISWNKRQNTLQHTSWDDVTRVNFSRPSVFAVSGEYRQLHFGTCARTKNSPSIQRVQQLAELALSNSSM
jgi:hypothetical protein